MRKISQKYLTICFLLFVGIYSNAQQDPLKFDYAKVDKHALSVKAEKSINVTELSEELTKPFSTDIEKARSIFRWVAENIAYDVKGVNSGSKRITFTASTKEELEQLMKQKELEIAHETIMKGSGLCSGYATLFKALCDEVGLETKIINGYARIDPRNLGPEDYFNQNHAWNAIKLNGKWFLLDATWASGYTDPAVTKYTKFFNDRYYLTEPEFFALDHFPKEKNWQLLSNEVTIKEFNNIPLIKKGFHTKRVTEFSPNEGFLTVKKGIPVTFSFRSNEKIKGITVAKSTDKYADLANFKKNGNEYSFKYYFQKKGTHIFNIFLDYQQTLVYRVVVK